MSFNRVYFPLSLSKSDRVSLFFLKFVFLSFPHWYHFGYYFLSSLYLMSKLIVVLAVVRRTSNLFFSEMKHDCPVINSFTGMVQCFHLSLDSP
uniref:Uncharacterized protein n=1 Tax=Solanum lycopersicum TaxID=4081 RepID=A0A3Q7EEH8_SOLLC